MKKEWLEDLRGRNVPDLYLQPYAFQVLGDREQRSSVPGSGAGSKTHIQREMIFMGRQAPHRMEVLSRGMYGGQDYPSHTTPLCGWRVQSDRT